MNSTGKPPLGLGIIGCGNVLSAYLPVADRLATRGLAKLMAVCGREHQRQRVTREIGAARFLTEHERLIESPDVDVVVILTPMRTHAALAKAALLAGKHVVLEKPLATNLKEAAELVELAHCSPGQLLCAPFTWLSPTFQTIWRRLHSGAIGRVVSARGRYGWAGPDWSEWFFKSGGGSIFDLAVYNLTTLVGLLGSVKRVSALSGVAIPERDIRGVRVPVEVEDNAQVLLDFGAARFAVVTSGFTIQQYRGPGVELYGTTGTIQLLGDDWDPDGYELWQNEAACWQVFKETQPDWPWADGLRHLVECVQAGVRCVVQPEHAYHVLEVMIAAHASSHEGRVVEVKSEVEPPTFAGAEAHLAVHRIHDRTRGE